MEIRPSRQVKDCGPVWSTWVTLKTFRQGYRPGETSLPTGIPYLLVTDEGHAMSVPARQGSRHASCRWGTIRYALGSNARTLRLCLILLTASIPPGLLVVIAHR
jgi:hypothetical protein